MFFRDSSKENTCCAHGAVSGVQILSDYKSKCTHILWIGDGRLTAADLLTDRARRWKPVDDQYRGSTL